jgi:hypothetical protein
MKHCLACAFGPTAVLLRGAPQAWATFKALFLAQFVLFAERMRYHNPI